MPKLSVPTLHAEMRAEAAIRNSEPEPPLSLVGQLSRSWSPTASGEGWLPPPRRRSEVDGGAAFWRFLPRVSQWHACCHGVDVVRLFHQRFRVPHAALHDEEFAIVNMDRAAELCQRVDD